MLGSFSLLCEAPVLVWCESSLLTSLWCVRVGCRRGRGCGLWRVAVVGGDARRGHAPGFRRAAHSVA